MHHYRGCARNPLKNWRFEPLSLAYFSLRRQREVGAAPHRGYANKPLTNQEKAKTKKPKGQKPKNQYLQNPGNNRQNHRKHQRRHKRKRILPPKHPQSHIPGHPPNPKLLKPRPAGRQHRHRDKRSQQPTDHHRFLKQNITAYATGRHWKTPAASPPAHAKTRSP